jgi:hypothetical protein
MLLAAGLVAAAGVAVLLVTTSAGGSNQTASGGASTTNAPGAHHGKSAASTNPSSVTVSVLNGTPSAGLAHRTATRLTAAGYKQGTIATASDQTRTTTIVAYLPGHRRDALGVARTLKLGTGAVQPVDSNTQAVACPPPSACTTSVVVTVGADLAGQ